MRQDLTGYAVTSLYVYTHFLCIPNENAGISGFRSTLQGPYLPRLPITTLYLEILSCFFVFFFLPKFLHNVQTWERGIHTTKESVHITLKTQHYPQPQKLPAHVPLAVQPI